MGYEAAKFTFSRTKKQINKTCCNVIVLYMYIEYMILKCVSFGLNE